MTVGYIYIVINDVTHICLMTSRPLSRLLCYYSYSQAVVHRSRPRCSWGDAAQRGRVVVSCRCESCRRGEAEEGEARRRSLDCLQVSSLSRLDRKVRDTPSVQDTRSCCLTSAAGSNKVSIFLTLIRLLLIFHYIIFILHEGRKNNKYIINRLLLIFVFHYDFLSIVYSIK